MDESTTIASMLTSIPTTADEPREAAELRFSGDALLEAFRHPAPQPIVAIPPDEPRPLTQLQELYRLERASARRLRAADSELRESLYGEVYDELFSRLRQADPPQVGVSVDPGDREELALQERLLESWLSPSVRFLEIGAGDGALCHRLAGKVRTAVAVDASEERIHGPDEDPPNMQRLVASRLTGAVKAGAVDLAYSCHFIEHLHPEDALDHAREVLRALATGGRYLVVTPNRIWGPHDISRYFSDEPLGLHLAEYTHHALCRLLRRAGFSSVQVVQGLPNQPRAASPTPVVAMERSLELLPLRWRRRALRRLAGEHRRPLRPLEQVVVLARKES